MKNIKILALLILTTIGFYSCSDDDSLTYTAKPVGEFTFTNTFLSEYLLSASTSGNLGERFTWDDADFDIPTNITYQLQKSLLGDETDMVVIGSTNGNQISLTIGELLSFAVQAGLDNDPSTDAPDTGMIYFRLRAFAGDASSNTEMFSDWASMTLVLPAAAGGDPVCEFDQMWGVGAGLPDAGWDWTTPVQVLCTGDGVYSANINLQNLGGTEPNNNFRFFTSAGDWASGLNYPHFVDAGYTIDAQFEDALDGDNNFAFNGTTGFYYLEIDTINKTITLDDPQATGVCEFDQMWGVGAGLPDAGWDWTTPVQVLCTGDGVYSRTINLQNLGGAEPNNNFRFFTSAGDWASGLNYPHFVDAGYTIDAQFEDAMDGDNNFAFNGTTGSYLLTIDTIAKTITLE